MRHFGTSDVMPTGTRNYRKTTIVPMLKMDEPFTCDNREGNNLRGHAGDFLVEDGHGGFYPVSAEFHAVNYEFAEPEAESQ